MWYIYLNIAIVKTNILQKRFIFLFLAVQNIVLFGNAGYIRELWRRFEKGRRSLDEAKYSLALFRGSGFYQSFGMY